MDADTIRSILILAAGLLAFSGALLTFVNNRFQAASTLEAKERLVANLLAGAEAGLWILGLVGSIALNSIVVALCFILPAFVMHCVAFLRVRGANLRFEVLMLALSMGFVVLMVCFYFILRVTDLLQELVERSVG